MVIAKYRSSVMVRDGKQSGSARRWDRVRLDAYRPGPDCSTDQAKSSDCLLAGRDAQLGLAHSAQLSRHRIK